MEIQNGNPKEIASHNTLELIVLMIDFLIKLKGKSFQKSNKKRSNISTERDLILKRLPKDLL